MKQQIQTPDMVNPLDPESGPIHNAEIERTVLSTLMTSSQALCETNDILTSECFYDSENREIFEAIHSLYNQGTFPDMMLVSNELSKRGSSITSFKVTEMCLTSTRVLDIHPHALILKDYSLRRKLWETGYNLMCQAANEFYPLPGIHKDAKEQIDALYESDSTELVTLQSSYKELQEHMLLNRSLPDGATFGTPTGFAEIDRNGGLCGSDLIVVGAETSQGKTAFSTALAVSAIEHGDGVAFYSLEMTAMQLAARIAAMKSGISSSRIMYQKLNIDEIYHIDHCMENFDASKMYFDERSTSSLDSILMSIRAMKMKYDIKGAVVDYLQLVNTKELGMNREQATAKCARDLKNIAKELGIWIIAISQLSRNAQSPVPSMARLRDSGQIEEAADNIFLIYRPRDSKNYPEPFTDVPADGTAMVIIGKGRHVGTGQFICGFKPENTLFYPLDDNSLINIKNMAIPLQNESKSLYDEDLPF